MATQQPQQTQAQPQQAQAQPAQPAGVKVFVGNLSFKTKEPSLASAFEGAKNVTIVQRRGRSLGYGFVEYSDEKSAKDAVAKMNQQTLDERQINVEIAKPRTEKPEGQGQARGPYRGSYGNRGGYRRGGYGNRGGNYSGGYRPRGSYPGGNFQPRGGYPGGNRGNYSNRPPRRFNNPRPPRQPLDETNAQPSQTSLFVTNLPFKYSDEDFAQIFIDAGIKPKSAKVARTFRQRSRGFGFIEFENKDQQTRALQAVDKKSVDGRELVVKIFFTRPEEQQTQGGQQAQQPKPAQTQGGQQAQQVKPATQPAQTQQTQQVKPAPQPSQGQQAPPQNKPAPQPAQTQQAPPQNKPAPTQTTPASPKAPQTSSPKTGPAQNKK